MGEHIDNRKQGQKKRKQFEGSQDARHNRVTFKNYLRQVEEELLEDELADDFDEEDDLSTR